MNARDYFAYKKQLLPSIKKAFNSLEEFADIIIEGAGSPAEINLREDDIVNMGMAEMVDATVIPFYPMAESIVIYWNNCTRGHNYVPT